MAVLSDTDIKNYLGSGGLVLSPLSDDTIRENGVDLRIGDEIKRFIHQDSSVDISDKGSIDALYATETVVDSFVLGPSERVLVKIKERVTMPDDLVGFCNVRSTFARLGISIPPTIIDSGFSGYLTILMIGGAVPIIIKKDMRMLHVIFNKTESKVSNPYAGGYQNSVGVTGAKDINSGKTERS